MSIGEHLYASMRERQGSTDPSWERIISAKRLKEWAGIRSTS
jgi:hypothetical protein